MNEFEDLTDDEYQEAIEVAHTIMHLFNGKDLDVCFAILDMCSEALEEAEKFHFQKNKYDINELN